MNKQSDSNQAQKNMSQSAPSQAAAGAGQRSHAPSADGSQSSRGATSGGLASSDSSQPSQADLPRGAEGEEMVDPVCGMVVDLSDEMTEHLDRNGKVIYFCSTECREQYEASPDDF